MSVYSGFATRQQESFYDKLIFKLLELLNDKLMICYLGDLSTFDEAGFARKVVKIYRTLKKMEQSKHLEPNMSESFADLSNILLQNYKDNSSAGSQISGISSIPTTSHNQIYGGYGYQVNNNLRDKVMKKKESSLEKTKDSDDASQSSLESQQPIDKGSSGLTAQKLMWHNIHQQKQHQQSAMNPRSSTQEKYQQNKDQQIQEEMNEEDDDQEENENRKRNQTDLTTQNSNGFGASQTNTADNIHEMKVLNFDTQSKTSKQSIQTCPPNLKNQNQRQNSNGHHQRTEDLRNSHSNFNNSGSPDMASKPHLHNKQRPKRQPSTNNEYNESNLNTSITVQDNPNTSFNGPQDSNTISQFPSSTAFENQSGPIMTMKEAKQTKMKRAKSKPPGGAVEELYYYQDAPKTPEMSNAMNRKAMVNSYLQRPLGPLKFAHQNKRVPTFAQNGFKDLQSESIPTLNESQHRLGNSNRSTATGGTHSKSSHIMNTYKQQQYMPQSHQQYQQPQLRGNSEKKSNNANFARNSQQHKAYMSKMNINGGSGNYKNNPGGTAKKMSRQGQVLAHNQGLNDNNIQTINKQYLEQLLERDNNNTSGPPKRGSHGGYSMEQSRQKPSSSGGSFGGPQQMKVNQYQNFYQNQ